MGAIAILIGYVTVVVVFTLFGADVDAKGIASTSTTTTCRSYKVKHKFDVQQGYPHGRKGYVVDHWCSLSCGGIDNISNMVYQTNAEAKIKNRWETTPLGCTKLCNTSNSTLTRQVFNCK